MAPLLAWRIMFFGVRDCLWRDQGKTKEAHDVLVPVYGWFAEGFDASDLAEARGLLEELK